MEERELEQNRRLREFRKSAAFKQHALIEADDKKLMVIKNIMDGGE